MAVISSLGLTFITVGKMLRYGIPWQFLLQELAVFLPISLLSFTACGCAILGTSLLVRRAGVHLFGCFVAAWIFTTVVCVAIAFATTRQDTDALKYFPVTVAGNALVLGILAILTAFGHYRLFVRKPPATPDTAF